MTGLPRGKLEVKYFADHVLEAEIAEQLFLVEVVGQGSQRLSK
jgi:hypothetical protein